MKQLFRQKKVLAILRNGEFVSSAQSGDENDWNKEKDGMSAMAGVEVKLGKVKLAPNLRLWMPDDTQLKNVCELYINASFSL